MTYHNINMHFIVYWYMSTLSLRSKKAAKARKAALDVINNSLKQQGQNIEQEFGTEDCYVIL